MVKWLKNEFWIDANKAIPAYNDQIVKVIVADFTKDYITYGYYNHNEQCWYSVEGWCLNDNVYAWKHKRNKKAKQHKGDH